MYLLGFKLIRVGWIIYFWLLNETQFVWLDLITRSVDNPINIFLINPNIILHHVLFIKYLWISKLSLVSIELKSTKKITASFNPVFYFILSIVKPFEILPKYNSKYFISEIFVWIDILL